MVFCNDLICIFALSHVSVHNQQSVASSLHSASSLALCSPARTCWHSLPTSRFATLSTQFACVGASLLPSLKAKPAQHQQVSTAAAAAVVACQSKLLLLLLCAHAQVHPIIVSLKQYSVLWGASSTRQLTTTRTACRQQHWPLPPFLPLPVHHLHDAMLSHNAGQSGHTTRQASPHRLGLIQNETTTRHPCTGSKSVVWCAGMQRGQ